MNGSFFSLAKQISSVQRCSLFLYVRQKLQTSPCAICGLNVCTKFLFNEFAVTFRTQFKSKPRTEKTASMLALNLLCQHKLTNGIGFAFAFESSVVCLWANVLPLAEKVNANLCSIDIGSHLLVHRNCLLAPICYL